MDQTFNPIQSLINALTIINPQELVEIGIDGFCDKLEGKFTLFADYVWGRFPHSPEDQKPLDCTSFEIEESESVDDIVSDACDGLVNIGIEDFEPLSAWLDYSVCLDNLQSALRQCSIESMPRDMVNKVAKQALSICQEYAVRMSSFVNDLANMLRTENGTFPTALSPTFFKSVSRDIHQLRNAYNYLIENFWIEENLDEDEFLYFFKGNGKASNKKIRWIEAKKYLALFIAAVSDGDDRWSTASKIFEIRDKRTGMFIPVTSQLRQNYYETINISNQNKLRENEEQIEAIFI